MFNFRRRHYHHHLRRRRIFTSTRADGTLVSGWCSSSMGRSKLHRQYYDQKRVGSYGGVAALQRVVPAERDVERWLSTQDAYTLHKPVRRRFKRRCVVVGGPNQQWQADLVDMSRLKQANNEITFLLTVIDVFSKRAWCVPLKSKSAAALVTAFTPLLNNRAPTTLQTDKGSEFFYKAPDPYPDVSVIMIVVVLGAFACLIRWRKNLLVRRQIAECINDVRRVRS